MAVLVALFVLAAVELWVVVQVAGALGALPTLLGLVAVCLLGLVLVKREGLKVWRRFNEVLLRGQMPSAELADGLLLLVAGALLIFPGFLTDVVAVLLLVPPTRALARRALLRRSRGRVQVIRATYRGPVVDTTARDTPPPTPPSGELGP